MASDTSDTDIVAGSNQKIAMGQSLEGLRVGLHAG